MEYPKILHLAKEFVLIFLALITYGSDRILGIAEDPVTTQAIIDHALFPFAEVIREVLVLALPLGLIVLVLVLTLEPVMDCIFGASDK